MRTTVGGRAQGRQSNSIEHTIWSGHRCLSGEPHDPTHARRHSTVGMSGTGRSSPARTPSAEHSDDLEAGLLDRGAPRDRGDFARCRELGRPPRTRLARCPAMDPGRAPRKTAGPPTTPPIPGPPPARRRDPTNDSVTTVCRAGRHAWRVSVMRELRDKHGVDGVEGPRGHERGKESQILLRLDRPTATLPEHRNARPDEHAGTAKDGPWPSS